MNGPRQLHFDWTPAKALKNQRKHGVAFTLAATVFADPRIQVIFDEDHSLSEERWVALGLAATGALLVVIHTWTEVDTLNVNVHLISARLATASESLAYGE